MDDVIVAKVIGAEGQISVSDTVLVQVQFGA